MSTELESTPIPVHLLSGKAIDLRHLEPRDIHLDEICIRLSRICRYSGGTPAFYSVAEHSLNLARYFQEGCCGPTDVERAHDLGIHTVTVWRWRQRGWLDYQLSGEEIADCQRAALLHDAAEAYIGDIVHPVKHGFCVPALFTLERQVMCTIVQALCPRSHVEISGVIKEIATAHDCLTAAELEIIGKDDSALYRDIISGHSQEVTASAMYDALRSLEVREHGK